MLAYYTLMAQTILGEAIILGWKLFAFRTCFFQLKGANADDSIPILIVLLLSS